MAPILPDPFILYFETFENEDHAKIKGRNKYIKKYKWKFQ